MQAVHPTLTEDAGWVLVEEGFAPVREHEVESLFTVANGYLGTRGSLQEGSALSQPATFIAGVYVTPPGSIPELAEAPDWARFRVFVDGEELRLDRGEVLEHRRWLDMRRGVLHREWRHRDDAGRVTRLHFLRFTSLADRHALVESLTLTAENYAGRVTVECTVEERASDVDLVSPPPPVDADPPPRGPLAEFHPGEADGRVPVVISALRTGVALAFAASCVFRPPEDTTAEHDTLEERGRIEDRWEWETDVGLTYRLDKLVSVYTSRESAHPGLAAEQHLRRLLAHGADALLADHEAAWRERWSTADVVVEGDLGDQLAIRFAIYHLIASANPEDERVSIGARALAGGSYKGHVFWDTEIYVLPFFVFTHPPTARALLMYRYHTLPGARAKARALGYRGALYAWESTDTGEETTPAFVLAPDGEVVAIRTGEQEHHVSADVAYAVWQYWRATLDDDFFAKAGAEIVLETARFWASRVSLGADGRYHILKVIGPDEYHEGVDDDAYTDGMARWNLERGAEAARVLQSRWPDVWADLSRRVGLAPDEPESWLEIAQYVYAGFDPKTGLFEQFRGYFDLDYVDLAAYEPRSGPLDILLDRERVARSQVIKQPDVLLLIYLLWDSFPPEVREANFRYYEPRCAHGSSLSPSIHALVAARLGDLDLADRYFRQSAEIDLANNMGNASGGVHVAAHGGLWQSLVFGFAGARTREDGLAFDPHVLPRWGGLHFPIQWRGRLVRADCSVAARPARGGAGSE